ncbi:MAG: matrixin family metalloprotease [Bifidobacteriaceae bacterium]|nr:matrixin family metalloprotease [Bifidobacteriaceae bacterium]
MEPAPYSLLGVASYRTWTWYYLPAGQPSNLSQSNVINRISAAANTWINFQNSCAISVAPAYLYQSYAGTTGGSGGIAQDQNGKLSCSTKPNVSNVGWVNYGNISALAATCNWAPLGGNDISTTTFNSYYPWRDAASTSGCSGGYDYQAVATHELGHAFGLAHVADTSHQVMKVHPAGGYCDMTARKLGRGDIRGLRHIYGYRP